MKYLNDALWKATRFGFNTKVVDPGDDQIISMAELVEKMVSYVHLSLKELGPDDIVAEIEEVLEPGNEAQEMRGYSTVSVLAGTLIFDYISDQ